MENYQFLERKTIFPLFLKGGRSIEITSTVSLMSFVFVLFEILKDFFHIIDIFTNFSREIGEDYYCAFWRRKRQFKLLQF